MSTELKEPKLGAFGKRMEEIRKHFQDNKGEFADKLRKSRTVFYDWDTDDTPTDAAFGAIMKAYPQLNDEWVNTGRGPMLKPVNNGGDGAELSNALIWYDPSRYGGSPVSQTQDAERMGGDVPQSEKIVRTKDEVYRYTGYKAHLLKPYFVKGDAMYPVISPNTEALYLPVDTFDSNGLFVVRSGKSEMVCQITNRMGGAVEIGFGNKERYEPEMLRPAIDEGEGMYRSDKTGMLVEIEVVGRIVYYAKTA